MIHPDPRQTPECNLERAGPIDAIRIRVLRAPIAPKQFEGVEKLRVATVQPGAREQHQVLMPAQLPNHLVVAGLLEIEIRDAEPRKVWRPDTVHRIEMPVDAAVAEGQPSISEQIEATLSNPARAFDDGIGFLW